MNRAGSSVEVIRDSSSGSGSRMQRSGSEWRSFMSPNIADMYHTPQVSKMQEDESEEEMDIRRLLKDVEFLGTSNMTWKEKKALENRRVVALGGKPTKKHRTPLSVAIPAMKNQKKKEQKQMEEERILGKFGYGSSKTKTKEKKLRPEDRALQTSVGYFSRGLLNVKHILDAEKPRANSDPVFTRKGKKKGKGKHGRGKGKGKGKGKAPGMGTTLGMDSEPMMEWILGNAIYYMPLPYGLSNTFMDGQ